MTVWQRWDDHRIDKLRKMWADGTRIEEIARQLSTSRGAIYTKASAIGLKRRSYGRGSRRQPEGDTTKQRRFAGKIGHEGARIVLDPWHPAARKGSTIFGKSVLPAARVARILKSGENSSKIGSWIKKGKWQGFPIFTLTLEERDTCPRTCKEWLTCFGSNMHWAERVLDDGTLTRRLWGELASLNAKYPGGFALRLHVLGDFYSTDYAAFWAQAVIDFPALHVFGFTARSPDDPIGEIVLGIGKIVPDRWALRQSGGVGEEMTSEVVDTADDVTGIRCPAEVDAQRSCATCALCWQTTKRISFVRH